MRNSTKSGVLASLLIAAGSMVGLAAISATGVSAGTESSTLPDTDATTLPAAPGGATLPELPVPSPAPADNEIEPQEFFGRIRIPAIEVDSPFISGIRLSTLDYGPGHWPGTAMPGELGNVVVAGHRTSHNADFRRLDELKVGDEVIYDLDNTDTIPTASLAADDPLSGVYVYKVTSVFRVPDTGLWIVSQNYRHETTLFACHPPGSVAERIVVQADLVSINGGPAPEPTDPPRIDSTQTTVLTPEDIEN